MSDEFKVGVFSPNDPRPGVRSDNLEMMLTCERYLVDALRARGIEVERGQGFETLRSFRHSFASFMIAIGARIMALSKAMGHKSTQMTFDRYGHLCPRSLRIQLTKQMTL